MPSFYCISGHARLVNRSARKNLVYPKIENYIAIFMIYVVSLRGSKLNGFVFDVLEVVG